MRTSLRCIFLLYFCAGLGTAQLVYANNQQTLSAIHKSISQQEKKLAQQHETRKKLMGELERQETAIARVLTTIQHITRKLTQVNHDIDILTRKISTLTQQQAEQQKLLSLQLENAFKLGRTTGLDLVFNQKESERSERIIAYFGYLNRARQAQMASLKTTHTALMAARKRLEEKQLAQQKGQQQQKKEHSRLEQNRAQRKKTLQALNMSMQESQQKLAQLYENEAKLQSSLAQAAQQSKSISEREARTAEQIRNRLKRVNYRLTFSEQSLMLRVSGIGTPKNRLDWPLLGRIRHHFGEPIQGQLHWKGLVIGSPEGARVRAIADGRVILANWLQGYGFVVALDHGKGDMTLYGYNQRVLVNVEDNVKRGQPIALVGNSGGQGEPGLYFEIRRDGKALDPQAWLLR